MTVFVVCIISNFHSHIQILNYTKFNNQIHIINMPNHLTLRSKREMVKYHPKYGRPTNDKTYKQKRYQIHTPNH